jgi:hypothetical protein
VVADGKAIEIGELDVEEDEIGLERSGADKGRRAVRRLADDLEPLRFKDRAGERPKARVIVNDQDGAYHPRIVAPSLRVGIRVGTGARASRSIGRAAGRRWLGRRLEPCRAR